MSTSGWIPPITGSRAVPPRTLESSGALQHILQVAFVHHKVVFIPNVMLPRLLSHLKSVKIPRATYCPPTFRATFATNRAFSSTTFRQGPRYVRFGGAPKRTWDFTKWDRHNQIFLGLALGGGVYYVTQCVGLLLDACRSGYLFACIAV